MASVVQQNQTTSVGTGTTLPLAYVTPTVGGNTLWCAVSTKDLTGATITVADSVNGAWIPLDLENDATNQQQTQHFYLPGANAAAGTPTVTATFSVASTLRAIWIVEIAGVTGAPLDGHTGQVQAAPGSGADAVSSGTATNASSPGFIVALSMDNRTVSPVAPAAGTAFTDLGAGWTLAGGNQARLESQRITSQSAVAATFTGTAGVAPTTVMAIFDELSPVAWNPPEPQRVYNKRLALVGAPGALAQAAFVAASIGFLPSSAPPSPQRLSPPAINQPHIPDVRKVGVGYLEANKSPALRPWQRPVRALNAESPPGARIVSAASSFVAGWNPIPAASPTRPTRAVNGTEATLGRLTTKFLDDWDDTPVRGKTWIGSAPQDAYGHLPALTPPATVTPWIEWSVVTAPVKLALLSLPPPPDTVLGTLLPAAPTSFIPWSVEPPRHQIQYGSEADLSADVFGQLTFGELVQSDPPPVAPLRAPRPDNSDPSLKSIGFAPSPSFAGWTVEVPAKAAFQRAQIYPETVLGTLFAPPPGEFAEWAPPLQLRALLSARPDTAQAVGAPLDLDELVGFNGWSSEPAAVCKLTPPRFADPLVLPTTQPPPGPWAPWSGDAAATSRQAAPRVQDQVPVGQSLATTPWAMWAPDAPPTWRAPSRAPVNEPWTLSSSTLAIVGFVSQPPWVSPTASRRPTADFALAPLTVPPTEFAVWSVEPPRVWSQPYSRPVNQPIASAVTLPPFEVFQQWSVDSVRGTAVKSRPPGESILTGSALPLPVLTGVPWASVGPQRGALPAPRPIAQDFLGAFLPVLSTFQQWAPDAPNRAALPAQSVQQGDVGALRSLVLTAFAQWSVEPRPAKPTQRASTVPDLDFTLSPVIYLTPFVAWSVDAQPRPSRAAAVDRSAFSLAPLVTLSGFVQWAADQPARQLAPASSPAQLPWALQAYFQPAPWRDFVSSDARTAYRAPFRDPEPSWSLQITVPPVVTAFQQWSAEPLRHWSQPVYRPDNQPFRMALVPIAVADFCHTSAVFDDSDAAGRVSVVFDDTDDPRTSPIDCC